MGSWDFPGGPVVKNPPTNAGDMGLILVWEDPTGCGATKPMHQTIEPTFQSSRATRTEPLHKGLEPVLHSNRGHHKCLEPVLHSNRGHHKCLEPVLHSNRGHHKCLEPVLHSNRGHHHENPLTKTKKSPSSLQLEKARMYQ